jgi:hypothetical protein
MLIPTPYPAGFQTPTILCQDMVYLNLIRCSRTSSDSEAKLRAKISSPMVQTLRFLCSEPEDIPNKDHGGMSYGH